MSITKLLYVLTMGVCLLTACKKNKLTSFEQELIWKTKTENPNCICDPFINKYNYKGNIVYMKSIAGVTCNGWPTFYGENGESFDLPQGMTVAEFVAQLEFIKQIYSCKEKPVTHQ